MFHYVAEGLGLGAVFILPEGLKSQIFSCLQGTTFDLHLR